MAGNYIARYINGETLFEGLLPAEQGEREALMAVATQGLGDYLNER